MHFGRSALLLLAIVFAAPLLSAAEAFQQNYAPATDDEWKKIKGGVTVEVGLNVSENHTHIVLESGQSVHIIPNPKDAWRLTGGSLDAKAVTWRGDPTQAVGMQKQLQIKVYPEGKQQGKPVTDGKASDASIWWSDVAALQDCTFSGPGEIVLRGAAKDLYRGSGKGAIRVKIVPVK